MWWELFSQNSQSKQICRINCGVCWVFPVEPSPNILSLCPFRPWFSNNQPLSFQKIEVLWHLKEYLFGIGTWLWAAKSLRFSHHASIVRGYNQYNFVFFFSKETRTLSVNNTCHGSPQRNVLLTKDPSNSLLFKIRKGKIHFKICQTVAW